MNLENVLKNYNRKTATKSTKTFSFISVRVDSVATHKRRHTHTHAAGLGVQMDVFREIRIQVGLTRKVSTQKAQPCVNFSPTLNCFLFTRTVMFP